MTVCHELARVRRAPIALLAFVLALLVPKAALAHQVGISRGTYTVTANGDVEAVIALSRAELSGAIEQPDLTATQPSVDAAKDAIARVFADKLKLTEGGRACPGSLASAIADTQDGVEITVRLACPTDIAGRVDAQIDAGFLDALSPGHRHVAKFEGAGAAREDILYTGKSSHAFEVKRVAVAASGSAGGAPTGRSSDLVAGLNEALRSLVSPVFGLLLGLLALGARGAVAPIGGACVGAVIGALVVSRGLDPGVTLGAAATAASVAYVGFDNVVEKVALRRDPSRLYRTAIGATFGVVHGARAASAAPTGAAIVFGAAAALVIAAAGALGAGLGFAAGRKPKLTTVAVAVSSALLGAGGAALFVKLLVH